MPALPSGHNDRVIADVRPGNAQQVSETQPRISCKIDGVGDFCRAHEVILTWGGVVEGENPRKFAPGIAKLHEYFPHLSDVAIDFFWSGKVARRAGFSWSAPFIGLKGSYLTIGMEQKGHFY
jgi:hypothetical protein